MGSLKESPQLRVSVLFGPKYQELDLSVQHIQRYLLDNPNVKWLSDAVQDLPAIWQDILYLWPEADTLAGETQLQQVSLSLRGGRPPPDLTDPMNFLLVPITVLRHVVDFCRLKAAQRDYEIDNIQGFCVGFLAAIVACWQDDQTQFANVLATVVRLAVCIGAVVDLNELREQRARSIAVRWKTPHQYQLLTESLARYPGAYISCVTDNNAVTVTVWTDQAAPLADEMEGHGLSVKATPLRGRFHNPDHMPVAQALLQLCKADSRFQLPPVNHKRGSPRSNINGRELDSELLIPAAIESILTTQANWDLTVSTTLNSMGRPGAKSLISIGPGQFIPRIARGLVLHTVGSNDSWNLPGSIRDTQIEPDTHYWTGNGDKGGAPAAARVPIAVTGIACRYPEADSVEALWKILDLGHCTVSQMPNCRLKGDQLRREPRGPFWGNYLARPDAFDHRFFGISAREAESMDPQQRLLLQVAYEAMESAGYCGLRTSELPQHVGCYVGVGSDDYSENVGSQNATAFSAKGTLQAFNSGRVSHFFGWTGPSITVDTACSSAAVAIHLACQALQTNDCSIALAGGVNVMTDPRWYQNLSAASFLSPSGASRAFDADADGYCRGEGAGLVVLRPLEAALRDGDPIHAVITGTSVNQGANCSPITVPDANSQSALYMEALSVSGLEPEDVSYVEAHGTGTQVGDPIEFESIRRTFGGPERAENLYVGSIKDNIGHTETSSGVAGMLKTILMLQKRRIPKQANFTRLNPNIEWQPTDRIIIPTRSIKWEADKRVAMVTNYGAAGSNAAIMISEPTSTPSSSTISHGERQPGHVPVFVSAKTEESLRAYCQALEGTIRDATQSNSNATEDVAYNLARKQNRAMNYLVAFSAAPDETAEVLKNLEAVASGRMAVERQPQTPYPVILCFGGQTGNAACISRDLFEVSHRLRFHLVECENTCKALNLPSLFPAIFDPLPNADIVILHCVLFSIQYATAKAWCDSGLRVSRMIGHSFGQLTALCVANGLSLKDAMRLISHRAQLIRREWGTSPGVMVSLRTTKDELEDLLSAASHTVDIACYNGADSFVLAGDEASIRKLESIAIERGLQPVMKRLKNTHAFHSRLVEPILPGLSEVANEISYMPLDIPVEVCSENEDEWLQVTGDRIVQHSRQPVYFNNAVRRALSRLNGPCLWLEAGAGSPVIGMVRRVVEASDASEGHVYLPTDLSGPPAQTNLAKVTCNLWSKGVQAQYWPFHQSQSRYKWINLPPYQFATTGHWIDYDPNAFHPTEPQQETNRMEETNVLRIVQRERGKCLFRINDKDSLYRICTAGHAVLDQSLCPASLYLELVVRAALSVSSTETNVSMYQIGDLTISAPLVLEISDAVFLELTGCGESLEKWTFVLFTRGGCQDPVTHATGNVALNPAGTSSRMSARFNSLKRLLNPSRLDSICTSSLSSGLKRFTVYQAFRRAVNYAEYYRGVEEVYALGSEATGRVLLTASPTKNSPCDPILVDNFIQVAGIHVNCLSNTSDDEVFVCSSVGEVLIGEPFVKRDPAAKLPWVVYSNYERDSGKKVLCDIFVVEPTGGGLALCVLSATFTSVSIQSLRRTLARLNSQAVSPANADPIATPDISALATSSVPEARPADNSHLDAMKAMLGELLGISPNEISATAALGDIGVDSLMSTEVLTEISRRFKIVISNSELAGIPDVAGLAQRIFPGSSVINTETRTAQPVEIDITMGKSIPQDHLADIKAAHQEGSRARVDKAAELFVATRSSTEYSQRTKFIGFCDRVFPRQLNLVTKYVVEAFEVLGVPLSSLKPGQAVPPVTVLPQHGKVMNQLYSVLEHSGLAHRSGGEVFRGQQAVGTVPSSMLHKEIIEEHDQHVSEHKLLHTTGSRLADCLRGYVDPLSLLFQDAKARALMTDVYSNAPMFKSATMHLTQYLKDLLIQYGSHKTIRILEIGAGTGGTTQYLLRELTTVPGLNIQYTFTDISSSLVTMARKRFTAYEFMSYTTLDIENEPSAGLQGQYDIILSSNCIHATSDLVNSCINIRKLLRPDGMLCLIELTRNLFWFDLVFGLLEGWWLFNDGRSHALANEQLWDQSLRQAGFAWTDWTDNDLEESKILRLIVASPTQPALVTEQKEDTNPIAVETVIYAKRNGLDLFADIYYPPTLDPDGKQRPIALLIHGGGHIMLSRKDIRLSQVKILLDMGLLPVSIDYRLCPEVSLLDGPMQDAAGALAWTRNGLPRLNLKRRDIHPDGHHVVAVGWSTGGHLAMTLAWTAPQYGVSAPEAILSFYSPTDYTDHFWTKPNFPYRREVSSCDDPNNSPLNMLQPSPITEYNPPSSKKPLGGWMDPSDPRSRIALHMNWKGLTLPVLFYGCNYKTLTADMEGHSAAVLPSPVLSEVQKVCPFSQISAGNYRTQTFIIHGTLDDLIPFQQAQRTHDKMVHCGIESELRLVLDGLHLFDMRADLSESKHAFQAVLDGYEFLRKHVGL